MHADAAQPGAFYARNLGPDETGPIAIAPSTIDLTNEMAFLRARVAALAGARTAGNARRAGLGNCWGYWLRRWGL